MNTKTGSALSCLRTVEELRRADLHVPAPLVESLIHEGETCLLVGRPKVGKSRIGTQLALSLSKGEPFLGHRVPTRRRVLMLDLENRPAVAQERLRRMSTSHERDQDVWYYAPETLIENELSMGTGHSDELQMLVECCDPDLLMIDTWRLLLLGADENRSDAVVNGLVQLSRLRRSRPRLAIMLVHHLRKRDMNAPVSLREDPYTWVESVSGHHALVGHVDCCWGLDREYAGGEELIVFGGVARSAAASAMLLEEDPETLLFRPANGEEALLKILTPKERELWTTAKELKRFTFSKLQQASGTSNKKALSAMLRKATDQAALVHQSDVYEIR